MKFLLDENLPYSLGEELQKVVKKDGRETYSITLPVEIVRAKQWQKGDPLKVEINREGDLILKRNLSQQVLRA